MNRVSQSLVIRFARWVGSNGGHMDSVVKLLDAAGNQSGIIKARINALMLNSDLRFSGDILDEMKTTFTDEEIEQIFTLDENGPYEWLK